ncbi:MAG: Ppx/GppA family phosphatase [Bdellovibrionaceae bacterium]|nr:Ppx/GppA family phosphatase [Pseudobdellovibrionaceae bacterium]NUM57551.1 Ppx/GppA family phosphatase [Pseudobdellovibrionaceae bacterium]
MRIAALDLGSNSFLCLLAEANHQGITRVHKDLVEIVRLGKDLNKTQVISRESLQRAKVCLENFKKEIDLFNPDKVLAYATSAARDATNSEEFFKIGRDLGIHIEIISGDKEALTTYRGVFWGFSSESKMSEKNLLIDIGGGSTEVILGQEMNLLNAVSIDIGAVRLTEKWLTGYPVKATELQLLKSHVLEEVSNQLSWVKQSPPQRVLAVAGTPTTLAAAELGGYVPEKVDGYVFTPEMLERWIEILSSSNLEEITTKFGIPRGRADILLSGIVILKTILEVFKLPEVVVSTRGVRYGVVANFFLEQIRE